MNKLNLKSLQKFHLQKESTMMMIWTIPDGYFVATKGVTENKIVPLNLGKEYCTVAMVTSTH